MKNKTSDRMGIILAVIISLTVIITMGVYVSTAGVDFGSLSSVIIVAIIVGLAIFVVFGRAKSIRRGLPAQDELSKRVMHKAGYHTFLCLMYVALGIPFIAENLNIEILGRHVSYLIILSGSVLFFTFYFWFNRKGDV